MLFECEPRGLSRRSSHSPCIKVTNVSIEAFRIGSRVLVPVSPHHFDPSFFNRFNSSRRYCKGRSGRKTKGESSTGTVQGGTNVKRNSERMQDQQEEEEEDE